MTLHTDDRPGDHADRPVGADRHLTEAEWYANNADPSIPANDPVQLATMHAAIACAKYLQAIETWTGRR